jgi:hypothetical protein
MKFKFNFLLVAVLLLTCSSALNWQGAGSWGNGNMTIIWDYINANFSKAWTHNTCVSQGDTTLTEFSSAFSTELNRLWDPAWNVVVVYITDGTNSDSVLYGYAFRDHWMWYNGFLMNDGYYVSFIIWKDYNCNGWASINHNTLTMQVYQGVNTFPTATNGLVYQFLTNFGVNREEDPWGAAGTFLTSLQNSNVAFQGQDKAYTVIISQSISAVYFAKVCALYYAYDQAYNLGISTIWGQSLLLQMR